MSRKTPDTTAGSKFAADSFALELEYNRDDFSHVDGDSPNSGGTNDLYGAPLYDGNISAVETHIGKTVGLKNEKLVGENYHYDMLGRLDSSSFHTFDSAGDTWDTATGQYMTRYEYDANGNIKKLRRHGYDTSGHSNQMDSLTYSYPNSSNNRLDKVNEAVTGDVYQGDIASGQSSGNYSYDSTGNLVSDASEGSMTMSWDSYGRIKQIQRTVVSSIHTIDFLYDAAGNRVKKTETIVAGGATNTTRTFYVYDAAGVVVAIYTQHCIDDPLAFVDSDGDGVPDATDNCPCTPNPDQMDANMNGVGDACEGMAVLPGDTDGDGLDDEHDPCPCDPENHCNDCPIKLAELPIYGIGRVGEMRPNLDISSAANTGPTYTREIGKKFYELTDHLGDVRMVISDIKKSIISGGVPGQFRADVRSYSNEYPFGMEQPGRWWDSSLAYRWGYNGMECDTEVSGGGDHYTSFFRQYDPRLGRWWSNDPMMSAGESPYTAMSDNPVALSDASGAQPGGGGTDPNGGATSPASSAMAGGGGANSGTGSADRKTTARSNTPNPIRPQLPRYNTDALTHLIPGMSTLTQSQSGGSSSTQSQMQVGPYSRNPYDPWSLFGWLHDFRTNTDHSEYARGIAGKIENTFVRPVDEFNVGIGGLLQFGLNYWYVYHGGPYVGSLPIQHVWGEAASEQEVNRATISLGIQIGLAVVGGVAALPGRAVAIAARIEAANAADVEAQNIIASSRAKWGVPEGATGMANIAVRPLTQADLGIQGVMQEVRGTFSVTEGVARVRVDMIRGEILNPLEVVKNLTNLAKQNGATILRIEGTLANERLYNVLVQRYGLTSEGGPDVINIPIP